MADMNHIHHQLLRLGMSHLYASILIILLNCLIIVLAFGLINVLGNNFTFLLILGLGFFLGNVPFEIIKYREKRSSGFSENKNIKEHFLPDENLV